MKKKKNNVELRLQDLMLAEKDIGRNLLNKSLDVIGNAISNGDDIPQGFMTKVCQVEVLAYLLNKKSPDMEDVIDFIKQQTYTNFIDLFGDVEALSDVDADFIANIKEIEDLFDDMDDLDDEFDDYEDLDDNCPL